MSMQEHITQDLKAAMLAGDKPLVSTLRGIKSVILYAEVASGKRDEGLGDEAITELLRKEAKKRQESADLFAKGGNQEKAGQELAELKVIEKYLPQQMGDDELKALVEQAIKEIDDASPAAMGRIIGKVKELSKGSADGARIAAAVKQGLMQS